MDLAADFYIKLRLSHTKVFDKMSDAGAASILRRMLHHATDGLLPPLPKDDVRAETLWDSIESELIQDQKDRENGRKGGRPYGSTQKTAQDARPSLADEEPAIDPKTGEEVRWCC